MEYDKAVKNRMKRIEGQVRGVLRMMEEEKECKDVIVQLSAARSALEKTIAVIVSKNLEQCVREKAANGEQSDDVVNEAVQLLVKSR
ncbi:metal-sensitive transcriptional regulator [Bacillus sp. Marseille-P3661]|uniref:metal-sensitive transcriptional regulator n=1 Tax=Bacillus sp. Marseille-P3661 TaxID=1936234 RepID=UPI000C848571|nr:metal-sensitive transcriptional regulator [Bacillus sp. Marseille-P3661]